VRGNVVPLRKPEPASPESPSPWILGEVFTRDGVDYELVTAGEIKFVVIDRPGHATVRGAPDALVRDVIDQCCD